MWRCCGLGLAAIALASSPAAQAKKSIAEVPVPASRILVAPLGFTAPAAIYQPYRIPESSLGFLDENHLLFTFHVARLMRRVPDDPSSNLDQTVRALVIDLPDGKVSAQEDWRLHDRDRYVWMLGDGTFLLRKRDAVFLGNKSLQQLHLYLQPLGTFMYGELAPAARNFEIEFVNQVHTLGDQGSTAPAPTLGPDAPRLDTPRQQYTMLIFNTHSLSSKRVNDLVHPIILPLIAGGYITPEQRKGREWALMMNPWQGAPHEITKLTSSCRPEIEPISDDTLLSLSCLPYTTDHIVQAFDLSGKELWEQRWQSRFVWGTFAFSHTGNRFAYGSIEVSHELGTLDPVEDESILGQPIGVFEVKTGKLDLVLSATPVMTAGENFALSPSGNKFAIVRNGAIEIYNLPPIETATEKPAGKSKQ
jgi:hypothetical protein